jgi:lipopolysaccharide/colanic/teichoic acid biosynthesis glycosyltransferase
MAASPTANRPRIAYVITSSQAAEFLRGHLAYLRKTGYDVSVISSPGKSLMRLGEAEGARFIAIPMTRGISPLRDLVSLCRLWRALRRLSPDIANVSTPKAGLLGGLAAVLARVPNRVYVLRGLRLETATGIRRSILWLAERLACLCAHRVICVSDSLRRKALSLGLVEMENTVVLCSGGSRGVDGIRFHPVPRSDPSVAEMRRKLGIAAEDLVVGFVGRFTRDKGVSDLLEAFSRLCPSFPQLRLLLVGAFDEEDPLPPSARRTITNDRKIVCPGSVSDTSLYYHIMDVVTLPTYREGLPNVVLEASASGKPVVVSRATGAVDSVKENVTGLLVPVGDSGALAESIGQLLRGPELRARMGLAGRNWIEQEFRPEAAWEAQAKLYCEMTEKNSRPRSRRGQLVKSAFDRVAATLALLVGSPLLLLIAVAIRMFQGRPILFRQMRIGFQERPFPCLKFRTMTDGRGEDGQLLPDEQRLTRLGRFLRSTSLDELPELINVIRGEMSLVGPRPLLTQYLDRYTLEQRRRHEAMPGITGWAQIHGRNLASWERKFDLDVWYVEHQSFSLDLKILAVTIWKTLRREGISQTGHATAKEFTGSPTLKSAREN